jgi:hypothetical protein
MLCIDTGLVNKPYHEAAQNQKDVTVLSLSFNMNSIWKGGWYFTTQVML